MKKINKRNERREEIKSRFLTDNEKFKESSLKKIEEIEKITGRTMEYCELKNMKKKRDIKEIKNTLKQFE